MDKQGLAHFRAQMKAELNRLEAQSSAKDVAGKAIGKWGLPCITVIIIIGVVASLALDSDKIAAVMGLLGAALTALISMLNGIAGATVKEEKPEFGVIKSLIDKLDRLDKPEQPMRVTVQGDKVTVTKGDDTVTATRE
jgi:uncharacterized membrane protein